MADLSKRTKDINEGYERAVWFDLHDPFGEVPGADEGRPVRFYTRSLNCRASQAWLETRKLTQEAIHLVPETSDDEAKTDDAKTTIREMLIRALVGWKNVDDSDSPLDFTPENARKILSLKDQNGRFWILEDLGGKAANLHNFGGVGKANLSAEALALKKSESAPSGDSPSPAISALTA